MNHISKKEPKISVNQDDFVLDIHARFMVMTSLCFYGGELLMSAHTNKLRGCPIKIIDIVSFWAVYSSRQI